MKVNHIVEKTDENAGDKEIVVKQLIILGIIVMWLIMSAFLFSGCSDSQGPDDSFDSTMASTSIPLA